MTRPAQHRRATPVRPIDPRPGLFLTCTICYPYLSDSMQSFPRSAAHDVVLAGILSVVWGAAFFWDALGRRLPAVRIVIQLILVLLIYGGVLALYGIDIYLLIARN